MATAKQEGGLYYVNGVAVDADGKKIEDAPKQAPDTDPAQQPGGLVATGQVSADPIQRLADILAPAISAKGEEKAGAKGEGKSKSKGE